MKKIIIALSIIALLPVALNAQRYGFYGNGKSIGVGYRGRSMYGGEVRNSGTLGMSSSVSAPGISSGSSNGVSSIGGGSSSGFSSGVAFGRTGTGVATRQVMSLSSTATLPQLATTTNSNNDSEGDQATQQGFLEAPDYEAPIGDAVLPLLLMIIPIIIVKVRVLGKLTSPTPKKPL